MGVGDRAGETNRTESFARVRACLRARARGGPSRGCEPDREGVRGETGGPWGPEDDREAVRPLDVLLQIEYKSLRSYFL